MTNHPRPFFLHAHVSWLNLLSLSVALQLGLSEPWAPRNPTHGSELKICFVGGDHYFRHLDGTEVRKRLELRGKQEGDAEKLVLEVHFLVISSKSTVLLTFSTC